VAAVWRARHTLSPTKFFKECQTLNKNNRRVVVFPLADSSDDVGFFLEALETQEHIGFLFRGHDHYQTDAVIEGAEHFRKRDVA
jgi:hypothetical protein